MNNQRKDDDKSLRSGERQVRVRLNDIEQWHRWRYEQTQPYITKNDSVLDLGMGCGYGSFIMASYAKSVIGIDDSKDAVNYAKKYWSKNNILHINGNVLDIIKTFDVIVAYELIEHVKDEETLIDKMKELANKYIIISVPHISVPLARSKWHWRHYTESDIKNKFEDDNWEIERIETPKFGKGLAVFAVIKRKL